MAEKSAIEWTSSTWNPVTGCVKTSPGCMHCYAERMAKRLKAMGQKNYTRGFEVALHPHCLDLPLSWKRPQLIFVNSMSDLFVEQVPSGFILDVFQTMNMATWHTFQVLTKRAERLGELAPGLPWAENIWMGVSVETHEYTHRIEHLRETRARVKFLSLEPLLGPLPELDLHGIDWVIVGGESGPGAREMREEWVVDIREQCVRSGVPFFFKQWGGVRKKAAGRQLQGRTWDQMPGACNRA